jgi:uncharacterized protein YcaQ
MVIKLLRNQVNTWRLTKQHLLDRASKSQLFRVVSEIAGVQAQVMSGAEIAIWARVDGITAQDVEDVLWKQRRLVKTWYMRGALHLLVADELPLYVAALRTRTNYRTRSWLKGHKVKLEEIDKITSEAWNSLDGRILTREELVNDILKRAGFGPRVKQGMLSGWGSLLHPAAYQGNLCFGPSRGKNVTFVRPDQWLTEWDEPSSEGALKILLRRFVTSYGPCSYKDFGHWWGVPESNARKILDLIKDELEEVEFEGLRTWLGKEDVEHIRSLDHSPSIRLVPSFDPYVMFYSPRERLVEAKFRTKVFRQLAGWNSPVLLIDGAAAGIWQYRKRSSGIQVNVEPFRPLSSHERQQVKDETARLGEFLGTAAKVSFSSAW